MRTRLVFPMFALVLLSSLIVASVAAAQVQMAPPAIQRDPATTARMLSSQQQAILAEAWTLTPQATAQASMSDLPLRNCEGLYCGVLATMPLGAQVEILVNDREGWALVHVPSRNMYGWVNTNNLY